ncbi:MAG: cytochrome c3 family protein [Vicinamibacteria bacterium]
MRLELALTTLGLIAALPLLLLRAQAASGPPHGDLSLDCGECHSPERWAPVGKLAFRHETTGFRLEDAHAQASCRGCHKSLVFNRVGTACADCHRDAHRGELGALCESCHVPRTWSNQREVFAVHSRTRFPLLAVHASLDCGACHRGQRPYEYANTPTECGQCHAHSYAQTTSPNHAQVGFSRRCEECHGVASRTWHEVTGFQHPASFPLTGPHRALACSACHGAGLAKVSNQCYSCHQSDYARTTNPNHASSRFPTTCESCHSGASWRPARFDHNLSRFALTGAHVSVDCARCHSGGRYTGTPAQCVGCHEANYRGATNPSHATFPTSCEGCHSTSAWRPAALDHDRTRFPLTGAHERVDCARCHQGGRYQGTPTDCVSCHRANYDRAANPSHSGFPTTCAGCHSTSGWRPASFDHDKTRFPLSGGHRGVDCARCHPGGRYQGTSTDCVSCHRADYDRTSNPNHASSGFPTSCTSCHSTSGWRPASFNHDGPYFPIYSGKHRGAWSTCADCHVSSGNYRQFECILCHKHSNRAEVDSKHKKVSGYAYNSAACYRCHPRGTEDD